jgi:hypothetical protein
VHPEMFLFSDKATAKIKLGHCGLKQAALGSNTEFNGIGGSRTYIPKTSLTVAKFYPSGKMKWLTTNTSQTQSTGATELNKRSLRRNKNLALRREIACKR